MSIFKFTGYIFLILGTVPFFMLFIYIGKSIVYSTENLHYFITSAFSESILQSFVLSFLTSFISLSIGLFLSFIFYTIKKRILHIIFIMIMTTAFILQPVILLSIFQQIKWFVNMSAFWQSLFISTIHLIPFSTLAFVYIFSTLNSLSLHNALSIAPWRYVIKWIVLPQLKVFTVSLFLLLFILVFIDQEVPSILGYRTYTEDLLAQITLMENMDQIVLSALPSYILVIFLLFLWGFIIKKSDFNIDARTFYFFTKLNLPFKRLGVWVLLVSVLYLFWMLAMLYLDFFEVSFVVLLKDNFDVVFKSIVFSFMTSVITILITLNIYDILEKYISPVFKIAYLGILIFYLLVPHSLTSLALLSIYQWIGYFSIFGDYLVFFMGYIFILLPVAIFLLYLFKTLKKDDYFIDFIPLSSYDKVTKIVLPQMFFIWVFILFILMVFSLNELSVSILLIPPGFETMVIKIYNLLHYGDKVTIAFLSLVQLLFIMFCFVFISWLAKRFYI